MTTKDDRLKLALILGSGFSKEVGLPTTGEIPKIFLEFPNKDVPGYFLPSEVEEEISRILNKFWQDIFGFCAGHDTPSLEDHFTLIDLAANSGHHLGKYYNPKRLRAIRRMSIHRVFSLVTVGSKKKEHIQKLLIELNNNFKLSIVTLNWDIAVERHLNKLGIEFDYPIDTFKLVGQSAGELYRCRNGIPLMKMHGSTNWVYCDACRRIYARKIRSTALIRKSFLEPDDFRLFETDENIIKHVELSREKSSCPWCENILAGRVATFSYRKAFSIAQFQTIWERAFAYLREADRWLIIGYSLPEADFEFLHLLKSAQLSRKKPEDLSIEVVIGGRPETVNRYKGVFGLNENSIKCGGLKEWDKKYFQQFVDQSK